MDIKHIVDNPPRASSLALLFSLCYCITIGEVCYCTIIGAVCYCTNIGVMYYCTNIAVVCYCNIIGVVYYCTTIGEPHSVAFKVASCQARIIDQRLTDE